MSAQRFQLFHQHIILKQQPFLLERTIPFFEVQELYALLFVSKLFRDYLLDETKCTWLWINIMKPMLPDSWKLALDKSTDTLKGKSKYSREIILQCVRYCNLMFYTDCQSCKDPEEYGLIYPPYLIRYCPSCMLQSSTNIMDLSRMYGFSQSERESFTIYYRSQANYCVYLNEYLEFKVGKTLKEIREIHMQKQVKKEIEFRAREGQIAKRENERIQQVTSLLYESFQSQYSTLQKSWRSLFNVNEKSIQQDVWEDAYYIVDISTTTLGEEDEKLISRIINRYIIQYAITEIVDSICHYINCVEEKQVIGKYLMKTSPHDLHTTLFYKFVFENSHENALKVINEVRKTRYEEERERLSTLKER